MIVQDSLPKKTKIQESIEKELSITQPDIVDPTEKILKKLALDVLKVKEWFDQGAIIDSNQDRIDGEYYQAEKKFNSLKIKLDSLKDMLKQLTEYQAWIFWLFRGAIKNDDHDRRLKDFYDAKRYIGFLYADTVLENCINNRLEIDCLEYLKKEYLEYLAVLSAEEYVRFKAYFYWLNKNNRTIDNNERRMKADYFEALEYIHNTMWNCKHDDPKKFMMECKNINIIKEYFSVADHATVKKGKTSTGKRLQYEKPSDINEFVDEFYNGLQNAFKNNSINEKEISNILNIIYKNYHVPNMLEFILKCFLCTYITVEDYNKIRKKYGVCR